MARKAQMEVFVLVGLIFLAASVVYLAYQALTFTPDSAPIGISQEEKLLREPISNLFKTGAEEALRIIEFQGGYSNFGSLEDETMEQTTTVSFLGGNVRYWSQCENTYIPDMDTEIIPRFESYIRKFIEERLPVLIEDSYRDVEMNIEDLDLDVRLTDNGMIVTINLPVTIEDYALNPAYVINVPTKFRKLYEFGRDFSIDQAANRHIEYFTVSSMYFSRDLATWGYLTSCGETLIQMQEQTAEGLENAISYTLMNTFFWKTADQQMEINEYYIPTVNGKKYLEFSPRLNVPDRFEVESFSEPIILINSQLIANNFP